MTHPSIALLILLTLSIGWLMTIAGLQKNALELRKRRRTCPSCGRHIHARVCSNCV